MNTPLISIVTVVYNAVTTLEQTILSVLDQTYKNIEYIVIDGGSTDGTVDIIKKYEDRLAYWVSEPDKGIYDAMNKGIDKATGEWVNFMNSGDLFFDIEVVEKIFLRINVIDFDVIYGHSIGLNNSKIAKSRVCNVSSRNPMPFSHQAVFTRTRIMQKNKFEISYTIIADKVLFHRLYAEGFHFYLVDIYIAIVDLNGFSSRSFSIYRQELNKLLLEENKLTQFSAFLYLQRARLKDYIRCLLK